MKESHLPAHFLELCVRSLLGKGKRARPATEQRCGRQGRGGGFGGSLRESRVPRFSRPLALHGGQAPGKPEPRT